MLKLLLSIGVVLSLTLTPAFAQDAARARPIKRDNVLRRAGAQFEQLDRNHDGVVDEAEMNAAIDEAIAKLRARMQTRFAEADANFDGQITRDEFIAARGAWFDSVDSNTDGVIDPKELSAYVSQRNSRAREGAKP